MQVTAFAPGSWSGLSNWPVEAWENRRDSRLARTFRASLSVQGVECAVAGWDIHRYGLGVLSRTPVPVGRLVCIRLGDTELVGFAYVRHCTGSGECGYRIGLELRDSLVQVETEAGDWKFKQMEPSDVWEDPSRPAS